MIILHEKYKNYQGKGIQERTSGTCSKGKPTRKKEREKALTATRRDLVSLISLINLLVREIRLGVFPSRSVNDAIWTALCAICPRIPIKSAISP